MTAPKELKEPLIDPYFKIEHIRSIQNPHQVVWMSMHQDYCCDPVTSPKQLRKVPRTEAEAGEAIVRNLLAGNKGHYGPLEHIGMVLNAQYFPHSTVQQLRTHRVGIKIDDPSEGYELLDSYDVQSFRYTGEMIIDVAHSRRPVEEVFYVRPIGLWRDRTGHVYEMTEERRAIKLQRCMDAAIAYAHDVEEEGEPYESARGLIPFDIRQHFVFSLNARSVMHLLDMRWKPNAQKEVQWFCELLFEQFAIWCPQIANWYKGNRKLRGLLAP